MDEAPRLLVVILLIVGLGVFGLFASQRTGADIQPLVEVEDQPLAEGKINITQVRLDTIGWVAIHRDIGGAPGEMIGFTAIPAGESVNIPVSLNVEQMTPALHAILHRDTTDASATEKPNNANRVIVGGQLVADTFQVLPTAHVAFSVAETSPTPTTLAAVTMSGATVAAITARDQPLMDGTVRVEQVVIDRKGWVTIYSDNNGQPGMMLGAQPVVPGETRDTTIAIDTSKTTSMLYAVLYADLGTQGAIEIPGADQPVIVSGQVVAAPFKLTGSVTQILPASGQGLLSWLLSIIALATLAAASIVAAILTSRAARV